MMATVEMIPDVVMEIHVPSTPCQGGAQAAMPEAAARAEEELTATNVNFRWHKEQQSQ
jgi:hypothetical protein